MSHLETWIAIVGMTVVTVLTRALFLMAGERVTVPPSPAPLTAEEKAAARANPALNRGLYAILIGLRREGVREWNYATNLHEPGGMGER